MKLGLNLFYQLNGLHSLLHTAFHNYNTSLPEVIYYAFYFVFLQVESIYSPVLDWRREHGMVTLNNPHLAQIHSTLVPDPNSEHQTLEFIPQLYYSLYQLKKEPNNSSISLENTTSSIRHRLKQCKSYIEESEECRTLLGQTCTEWEHAIEQRERELEVKKQVLTTLSEQIKQLKGT